MKQLFTLILSTLFIGQISAQLNFTYKSNLSFGQESSDIWGYKHEPTGVEYAIVGLNGGTSIVSLENVENPVEIAYFPGTSSIWRDIKTWGTYAYVVNDIAGGMDIIDFTPLPDNPPTKTTYIEVVGLGMLGHAHNIYIDENGFAYLAGSNLNSGGIVILDVHTDPANPTLAGLAPATYAHDVYARDNKLYTSDISNGVFSIYDVSDKSNIILRARQATPFNYTHNTWLSDDGNYLFTTDELANAPVASYDISDLSDIKELDQFRPYETLGDGVIPHNTHVWQNWLVISYYTDGCIIVDASRPDNLIEVGNFDSFIPASTGFSGAWGAYPFLPSGLVLVSDIESGLFVLEPNYVLAAYLEGIVRSATNNQGLSGASLKIVGTNVDSKSDFNGAIKTGYAIAGDFNLEISHPTHYTKTITVKLENGVVTPFDVTLEAQPTFSFSGSVRDEDTNAPVEGAIVRLESETLGGIQTTTNASGLYSFSTVVGGDYDLLVGKWGYKTNIFNQSIGSNASSDVKIEAGIQDNFSLDLGWKVSSNVPQGAWERGMPIEVSAPGGIGVIAPGFDYGDDDLGNSCYVTGNTADLFSGVLLNGSSSLVSPKMDLSHYGDPELSFVTWLFTFNTNAYLPSPDVLEIRISNGDSTILLDEVTFTSLASPIGWEPHIFRLKDYIGLSDSMKVSIVASTPSGSRVMEAGVDFFEIIDLNPNTGTKEPFLTSAHIQAFPNPSSNGFTLNYQLPGNTREAQLVVYNILGQEQVRYDLDTDRGDVYFNPIRKGIYLAQIVVNGKVTKSIKLMGQ